MTPASRPTAITDAENGRTLRVAVLTSSGLGARMAALLAESPAVRGITLITAPLGNPRRATMAKLRELHRMQGMPGLWSSLLTRLRSPRREPLHVVFARQASALAPEVRHVHLPSFRQPEASIAVRDANADLGVVVATPKLDRDVFSAPRLGSINIHFGKAPYYRGSSPAFWELFHGESEVGITIHWVTETLDGGDILLQESLPLERAPRGDPMEYLQRYRQELLFPGGLRLAVAAVEHIARGTTNPQQQDHSRARTFRRASYSAQRELRRRVAERLRELEAH